LSTSGVRDRGNLGREVPPYPARPGAAEALSTSAGPIMTLGGSASLEDCLTAILPLNWIHTEATVSIIGSKLPECLRRQTIRDRPTVSWSKRGTVFLAGVASTLTAVPDRWATPRPIASQMAT